MSRAAVQPPQVVLMSIRPMYADRILRGEKRFEIRRRAVRLAPDDLVIVYASAPVKAVVGAFTVKRVHVDTPAFLWRRYSEFMGVTRSAYQEYLRGTDLACAIEVRAVVSLPNVGLDDLRAQQASFRPPQSYMFVGDDHASGLHAVATDARERSRLSA